MAFLAKKKGNSFERECVHILTEHFGQGFSRVPQSGAAFGGTNFRRAEGFSNNAMTVLVGDIITPELFPFSIECKSYKSLQFFQLLKGSCTQLDGWISQSEQDCLLSKKQPIIFFKLNNIGIFCCIKNDLIKNVSIENYVKYKNYTIITMDVFLDIYKDLEILKDFLSKIINNNKKDGQNVIDEKI